MTTATWGRQRTIAVMMGLGSMSSVQLGAALSQPLFERLGPAGVSALRMLLSAIVLLLIARPKLRHRTRHELLTVLGLGVATGVLTLGFYASISRIPLGIATAIEFLGPLSVGMLGLQRIRDFAWVLIAAGGVALLTLGHPIHGSLNTVGVLMALVAGAGWAVYIVLTKRVGATWPGLSGLAISLSIAALMSVVVSIPHAGHRYGDPTRDLEATALGVLVPLLPFVLELLALRRVPARLFGVLMSLEPGFGAIFGFLINGQSLTSGGVLAIMMVITASVGVTLTAKDDEDAPVALVID